ncbi:MAG: glutamine--fructose-6-phosphate transaminase (isomerizing) [Alphaproteobacteria bacterium]|nr:glutamine--fructose-6-phosphate transaminase (isomerizing) [Alphaproteobacteria bacterium]
MCGIIGVIGATDAAPILLDGLRRLEYRGYDSAGVATLVNGRVERRRAEGKIGNLADRIAREPIAGTIGIGHTRWATHGVPNETNAHPHTAGRVVVVHNGIIENYRALRDELGAAGRRFDSDTDSEVVAHLIDHYLNKGMAPREAMAKALGRLEGAFALGILIAGEDKLMIGARRGSPLAVGWGDGSMYLGSDAIALAPFTRKVTYLDDGDWVVLSQTGAEIFDGTGDRVERPVQISSYGGAAAGKGNFRHFMEREIHEQPEVIGETLHGFMDAVERRASFPGLSYDLTAAPRMTIVACGTSYYAGLVAKVWFERYAGLSCDVDIASEFRYRRPPMPPGGIAVFVSQSGETADTLAAMRYAKEQGQHSVALVNVPESTIAREAHAHLVTRAGPEIGVASTKAFTTQLAVLALLAVATARARGRIDATEERRLIDALVEVPGRVLNVLHQNGRIEAIARANLVGARDVLYIGRGTSYPIAMEGALKLKEISYIHAEGYAAGEIKHGPFALIDETVPVVAIAPSDELFEKTASNLQEAVARRGRVIFIGDAHGILNLGNLAMTTIEMPRVDAFVAPLLYAIPVQLLAYYTAVLKGTDVDQPRNLAKSVTVE